MRKLFFALSLLAFLVLAGLTLLVHKGQLVHTDFNVTVKLQDKIPKKLDRYFGIFVEGGSMEVMTGLLLVTVFLAKISLKDKLFIVFLYVFGLLIVLAGKNTLHHPAPQYMFQRDSGTGQFSKFYVHEDYSFPSGHTYRTFFVASLIVFLLLQKKTEKRLMLTIVPLTIGVLIAIALIVLGKHWASDVIGGGSLAIFLLSSAFLMIKPHTPVPAQE